MLRPIATLETSTTRVQVTDASWEEPTEIITRFDRPMLSMMICRSDYAAEGAFLDGTEQHVGKVGRVFFTPADIDVLGRGNIGTMRIVACFFDPSLYERIVGPKRLSESQLRRCLDVKSPLLQSMLTRLMTEALHPGFVSAALVEAFGQAMLVECAHTVLSQECENRRGRLLARHLHIIDEYLETLIGRAPSVSEIASACGFSERYFAKLFRERMNQAIGRYLKSAQIAKAQNYLLQTDLPLKEIAFRLGFSGPSNFSDAFRAATGEPPGHFRSTRRRS